MYKLHFLIQEYDCPLLPDLGELISWVAGGSLAAAESLVKGETLRAINWGGGWHHAQRDEAAGFCYVNDIVLAIHALRKKFDRVLYIDLDVHHGMLQGFITKEGCTVWRFNSRSSL